MVRSDQNHVCTPANVLLDERMQTKSTHIQVLGTTNSHLAHARANPRKLKPAKIQQFPIAVMHARHIQGACLTYTGCDGFVDHITVIFARGTQNLTRGPFMIITGPPSYPMFPLALLEP
eukprot:221524-Chlamydomonas_euryale.AAC.2